MGTDGPLVAYVSAGSLRGTQLDRREECVASWAEAVLVEAARRTDPDHPVARSIRIAGVRGDVDGPVAEGDPAMVSALFDPGETWTGDESVLVPLFAWRSWDALKDYLTDHGFDDAQIDEQIDPVTAQGATSDASPAAVAEYFATYVDPTLREAICGYFASVTDAYLASWRRVDDGPARTVFAFPDHVREGRSA